MHKSTTWLRIALLAISGTVLTLPAAQAAKKETTKKVAGNFADGIVAIVNTDVITQRQLHNRMAAMRVSGQRGVAEQVLQNMIDEKIMDQHASDQGIEVDDQRLSQVLADIARQNNLTVEGLQAAAKKQGLNWEEYLNNLRQQVRMDDLRNRVVQSRVNVTPYDIDAFLAAHPTGMAPEHKARLKPVAPVEEKRVVVERSFDPKAIALQHIFIRVPDNATPEVEAAARKKANAALAQIRAGKNFGAVASQYSEGPEAANGGDLGIRMNEDWPALFISQTKNVRDGRSTGVFRAPNGFHILRVVERRGVINEQRKVVSVKVPQAQPSVNPRQQAAMQQGPVEVTETHIRHILVPINPVVSDQQAKAQIDQIYQQLQGGVAFADLAMKYSKDTSAPMGGDIGWIGPGQADPAFEATVNHLQVGQYSPPVRSTFGWHIIEVLDRRTSDKKDAIRRDLARENLYDEQAQNVLDDWIQQLRSQAYIENRLTGQKNR